MGVTYKVVCLFFASCFHGETGEIPQHFNNASELSAYCTGILDASCKTGVYKNANYVSFHIPNSTKPLSPEDFIQQSRRRSRIRSFYHEFLTTSAPASTTPPSVTRPSSRLCVVTFAIVKRKYAADDRGQRRKKDNRRRRKVASHSFLQNTFLVLLH